MTNTRHALDTATVATLRKLVGTKKGRKTVAIHRDHYNSAMAKMGFDMTTTYHGFNDCYAMAELENEARAILGLDRPLTAADEKLINDMLA